MSQHTEVLSARAEVETGPPVQPLASRARDLEQRGYALSREGDRLRNAAKAMQAAADLVHSGQTISVDREVVMINGIRGLGPPGLAEMIRRLVAEQLIASAEIVANEVPNER